MSDTPKRPDLRDIAKNIEEAVADLPAEALRAILVQVFREYVVEGPPPALVHQVESAADLEGKSFAELITALQTRLDVPELEHFDVENGVVHVRVEGRRTPLTGQATRSSMQTASPPPPATAPSAPAQPTETAASGSRTSVEEAVRRGRGDLAGGSRGEVTAPAPRPRGGVSVSSSPRPMGAGGAPASGAPQQAAAEPKDAGKGEPPPEQSDKGSGDDDASVRFSLLELD